MVTCYPTGSGFIIGEPAGANLSWFLLTDFPTMDFDDKIDVVLNEVKTAGMVVEVNTAGLRKPVQEIYPSRPILEKIFEEQIDITLGSDAHKPEDVGYAFDEAIALIKEIGFDHLVTFKRRVKQVINLNDLP